MKQPRVEQHDISRATNELETVVAKINAPRLKSPADVGGSAGVTIASFLAHQMVRTRRQQGDSISLRSLSRSWT